MADRIFKYELQMVQRQMFLLPPTSKPLSVAVINEQPVIFVIHHVDPNETAPQQRIFRIARTGERFNVAGCEFVGSLIFNIGHTFHVFEQKLGNSDPIEPRFQSDYAEVRKAMRDES